MIIALDWDGVCTAEPKGFATFVNTMRSLRHKVYIVTMRYPSECLGDKEMCKWAHGVDGVVATKREAKRSIMEALGLKVQVWVDDHPEAVAGSAVAIWGSASPEGDVYTVDHSTGVQSSIKVTSDTGAEHQLEMKRKLLYIEDPVVEKAVVPVAKKAPVKIDGCSGFNNTDDLIKPGSGSLVENVLLAVYGTTSMNGSINEVMTQKQIDNMSNLPVVRVFGNNYKAVVLAQARRVRQEIFEDKQLIYGDLELSTINATWPELDLKLFYHALNEADNMIEFRTLCDGSQSHSSTRVMAWGVVLEKPQVTSAATTNAERLYKGALGINNVKDIVKKSETVYQNILLGVFGVEGTNGNFIPRLEDEVIKRDRPWVLMRAHEDNLREIIKSGGAIHLHKSLATITNLRSEMDGEKQLVFGDIKLVEKLPIDVTIDKDLLHMFLNREGGSIRFGPVYAKTGDGTFVQMLGWGVTLQDDDVTNVEVAIPSDAIISD